MRKATCLTEGCRKSVSAKGYCYTHYRRMHRRGAFGRCEIPGCENGNDRGDLCQAHYMRKIRGASMESPLIRRFKDDLSESLESGDMQEVFLKVKARCIINSEAGCWEYPRANGKGYGELQAGRRTILTHRLMAQIALPEFEDHLQVHHKCANRVCCNPAHLQALTSRENRAEMMERTKYLKRIGDLEEALRDISPEHPLIGG